LLTECSGNRLQILPDEFEDGRAQKAFLGVKDLSVDEMLLSWEEICLLARQFKDIMTLDASLNDFLTLPTLGLSSLLPTTLTSLKLEYNGFSSLSDLLPLTGLTSLKTLHLKGNHISTICAESQNKMPVFGAQLHYIDLSYNHITSWAFVDLLPVIFPGMTALRISHNSVYEVVVKAGDAATSVDEGYMLALARLANLRSLNFSTITTADRTNAEMFYLSRIGKEMAAVPESEEHAITSKHRRYAELCEIYGTPVVVRAGKAINPDLLEARLIKFTFYLAGSTVVGQTETKVQEIPRGFDMYRIKGIVGKLFGLRPLGLRLIWETGEWDPVAGYEDEEEDSEDEEGSDAVDAAAESRREMGKWMRREVELEDGTRQVGFCVDGMEARVRIELR